MTAFLASGPSMIHSMTGFAAARSDTEFGVLSVELRSLNHRYSELSIRLPEELRVTEPTLRQMLSARVKRGKLDATVRFRAQAGGTSTGMALNEPLARKLAEVADQARALFPDAQPGDLPGWLAWPGVVNQPEADLTPLHQELLGLVEAALAELVAYRRREGEQLAALINERLAEVKSITAQVRKWMPEIAQRQRARMIEKVQALTEVSADESRLEQEIAFILQRMDVDEELDRLDAHVAEVERSLASDKPIGRRLDFLMQELNREANTLGSKSADARASQACVDLKVLIEQMREQVQNIE